MHERAPVGQAALGLLDRIDPADPPSKVTVAVAPDVQLEIAADAWEAAVSGTALDDVPVAWVVHRPILACFVCGHEYEGEPLDRCPECGGDGLVVEDVPVAEVVSWER